MCQWVEWFANRIQYWSVFGYVQLFKCIFSSSVSSLPVRIEDLSRNFRLKLCGNLIVSNYFILGYWTRTKNKNKQKIHRTFVRLRNNRKNSKDHFFVWKYHPGSNFITTSTTTTTTYNLTCSVSRVIRILEENTHGKHYTHHRILLIKISVLLYSYLISSIHSRSVWLFI